MGRLTNRVALITGGSKGIGLAIARAFAAEGASIALAARNEVTLAQAVAEIEGMGVPAMAVSCDITDRERVHDLPARIADALGRIDILVNNAGAAESHKFIDHPDELWDWMLAVNLTSIYQVTKAVVPGMVEHRWGRIINIASVASKVGFNYMTAYAASKHGVLGLTRSLAVELNPYHITVNAVCPSYVDTPMTDAAVANIVARTGRSESESRRYLEGVNPQNRLIAPEEVAAVALMLADENARGITGQAINVDGGLVMF